MDKAGFKSSGGVDFKAIKNQLLATYRSRLLEGLSYVLITEKDGMLSKPKKKVGQSIARKTLEGITQADRETFAKLARAWVQTLFEVPEGKQADFDAACSQAGENLVKGIQTLVCETQKSAELAEQVDGLVEASFETLEKAGFAASKKVDVKAFTEKMATIQVFILPKLIASFNDDARFNTADAIGKKMIRDKMAELMRQAGHESEQPEKESENATGEPDLHRQWVAPPKGWPATAAHVALTTVLSTLSVVGIHQSGLLHPEKAGRPQMVAVETDRTETIEAVKATLTSLLEEGESVIPPSRDLDGTLEALLKTESGAWFVRVFADDAYQVKALDGSMNLELNAPEGEEQAWVLVVDSGSGEKSVTEVGENSDISRFGQQLREKLPEVEKGFGP